MTQSDAAAAGTGAVPATAAADSSKPGQREAALAWKPAALIALTGLADFLFYGHESGWTLGLFWFAVLLAMAVCNPRLLAPKRGWLLFLFNAGLCVALIEEPSWLAVTLLLAGLASFALSDRAPAFRDAMRWAQGLFTFATQAVVRPWADALAAIVSVRISSTSGGVREAASAWLVPLVFAGLFTTLFGWANPIIGGWLDMLRLPAIELPPAARVMFWLAVAFGLWSFLNPWLYPVLRWQDPAWMEPEARAAARPSTLWQFLFSPASIVRSMLLFNALFAVQNGLDLVYLWGGRALPDGFTYATYAHRGAYPLIVTALLAAAFVLVAFRDVGKADQSPLMRRLMYLWIGQNVALVLSSIWRTVIYVELYALTYLRLAALIWMGVVAAGLLWLVVRFVRERSNTWLLDVNVSTAAAVLYVASFLDLGGFIADYNVRRCREVGGPALHLDLQYLRDIGPSAVPALRWYADAAKLHFPGSAGSAAVIADGLESDIRFSIADWRRWTFRRHRLAKRIDAQAAANWRVYPSSSSRMASSVSHCSSAAESSVCAAARRAVAAAKAIGSRL